MNFALSPHIEQVNFPPISEVRSWIAGRSFSPEQPLIDLCQAIPDYPPPPELLDHLKPLLDDPATSKYSPDEGLPEVRAAVCSWYARRYGAGPNPQQLCLTIGASQAFWLAMLVLCQAGDEVIVQLPAYFDHPMALGALGIKPVYLPFAADNGGLPDLERLRDAITPRTRAILLVSPSNPTGAILPAPLIAEILDLARRHRIALVLDETYNAFVPDPPPHRLFTAPDWGENFIHIASFGKTFALTGFRAGALVAAEPFIHHALKVQDTMAVCQPRITQHAIRYGCEHLDRWVASNRDLMQQRHDAFCRAFSQPGNPFAIVASGGFFAWVRHPYPGRTSHSIARSLAQHAGLLCLPGAAFGPGLDAYLRLAFGNIATGSIPAAVERFRQELPA